MSFLASYLDGWHNAYDLYSLVNSPSSNSMIANALLLSFEIKVFISFAVVFFFLMLEFF